MPCLLHRLEGPGAPRPFAEPGVGPSYGPDHPIRIDAIRLWLSVEPREQTFSGRAALDLRPLPTARGVARLDLDEVQVDAVTDADGNALAYRHEGPVLEIFGVTQPMTVVVTWHGADPVHGLYFTGPTRHEPDRQHMAWTQCQDADGHFVFPCHDHPGVKHPWRIELDAPAGYTLLSNGARVSHEERDGRSRAVFEQSDPMPAYLFTAVVAQLSTVEARWRDREVRYLVPVGSEEAVARSMGKTPLMIEAFSQRLGVDYPWPRYDQVVVHDFIFGGMENVACTTMTDLLLVDERVTLHWDPDGLVAHELAHQWFGDLVTCQDWSQAWLNESWATFMEVVWWEHDRDDTDAVWYRYQLARAYLEEDSTRYRRPIVSYGFREPIDVFDRHLYEKGACVLDGLRAVIGADAFWAGVRDYLTDNAHATVHSRDFQRSMERHSGVNLDRFFRQWVHGAGHPELEVRLSRQESLLLVAVQQGQSGEGTAAVFHFPLNLEIVYDDGRTQTVRLPVAERERTFAVVTDAEVRTVRVDPGFHVLSTLKLDAPRGWLEATLSDPCPVLALRSAEALLREGSPKAFDAVVAAMGAHPFHGVRSALARRIGRHGGPAALAALLDRLPQEQDPRALRGLASALGRFRCTEAAEALAGLLAGGPETWHLLGDVLAALGATRDPRAPALIEPYIATRSWGDVVAQRAVEGLAATHAPEVVDRVLAESGTDRPDRLRAAACRALAVLARWLPEHRPRLVERLVEVLDEPGFRSILGATRGLATLGDPSALPSLQRLHESAADGRHQRAAYEAMTSIRKGRTSEESLVALRRRIEELAEQNQQLSARIDKLERHTTPT